MMIDLLNSVPLKELMASAQAVSQRYRALEKPYLRCHNDYVAYVAMRLPGTLAAISSVLKRIPDADTVQTLLDLGAGPGTGWLAAQACLSSLQAATLIEADPTFITIGQRLAHSATTWQQSTLPCSLQPHDLVMMSYSLGEMPKPVERVIDAWNAAEQYLVIIEPGTPTGYELIMKVRSALLEMGAHLVAPCPNALPCPLQPDDWCHFPARVERSKLHMQLKGGTLGYEDEKFSYIIFSKEPIALPKARIIDNPKRYKGHISCRLCTGGHISDTIISKRQGEVYTHAKKHAWGDEFNF